MSGYAIHVEPGAGSKPVTQVIASARRALDINAYMLTSRAVAGAIKRACHHHVRVRIIIDTRPYGASRIVKREKRLLSHSCAVVHAPPKRFDRDYHYDHAKYVVADPGGAGEALISTGNFTYDGFHRDRDFVFTTRQKGIVSALGKVFNDDWSGRRVGPGVRHRLVLSPHAGPALMAAIQQPGPIWVETEELGHAKRELAALAAKGASAHVLIPRREATHARRAVRYLEHAHVGVHVASSPYIHAKAIAGGKVTYMGSVNLSYPSLHNNREVGVILKGDNPVLRQLKSDWHSSHHP